MGYENIIIVRDDNSLDELLNQLHNKNYIWWNGDNVLNYKSDNNIINKHYPFVILFDNFTNKKGYASFHWEVSWSGFEGSESDMKKSIKYWNEKGVTCVEWTIGLDLSELINANKLGLL